MRDNYGLGLGMLESRMVVVAYEIEDGGNSL